MAEADKVVALNIGSQRIAMALFETGKGKSLRMTGYETASILADPAAEMVRLSQVQLAIRELSEKLKLSKHTKVRYTLSGQSVFAKFVKLPPLAEDNLEQLITFEAQQNVPFPLDEVAWDWALMGSEGVEKEVALVAIKSDILNDYNEAVADAGLVTELVDAAPMALYNSFRYNNPNPEGCSLLIDMGARTCDLIYIENERLFSRSASIGGVTLTTAVAKEYSLSFPEAEALKTSKGMVAMGGAHLEQLDDETAALAMLLRNTLNKLPSEIARTNNYYRSQFKGSAPQKIYLAGGGANLPYLKEFLEEKLKLPVEFYNPLRAISVGSGVDTTELSREAHLCGALIGLGLRGAGLASLEIDLVPDAVDTQRSADRRKPFFIAAAATLLVGAMSWAGFKAYEVGVVEKELEGLKQEVAQIEPVAQKVKTLEESLKKLSAVGDQYAHAQKGRIQWIEMLSELRSHFAHDAVWLTQLEPLTGYEAAGGESKSGQPVLIEGIDSLTYGDALEADIKAPQVEVPKNQRPGIQESKMNTLEINAVRIRGLWRQNPSKANAVYELIENMRKDEGSHFSFVNEETQKGLGNDDILKSLASPKSGSSQLAWPFELVLPLKKNVKCVK